VQILVAVPTGNYEVSSGTSYAAAEVSGIVALMLQREPGLTPDRVRDILLETARDLGPKGRDPLFGAGLADAYGAVTTDKPPLASVVPLPAGRASTGAHGRRRAAKRPASRGEHCAASRVYLYRPVTAGRQKALGMSRIDSAPSHPAKTTRRDFLYIATASVAAVGAGATLVPLVSQMNPDAATLAAGGPVELDLSKVAPGQQVQVRWRSRPIFVLNRTPAALKALQSPALTERLADPQSQAHQQPPYAQNWHRSVKPEFGVLVGICTHLGCIPLFYPQPDPASPATNWPGGYFCPCHGSKYDLAGRVFAGVPAPYNLPVPPYHFVSDSKIRIGENPKGVNFDFASINQI
jgi:ubiquinol-cytochrome c reductase iron-sulfur subunit